MKNNLLTWFWDTFHDDYDEYGSHKVSTFDSYFAQEVEKEMLEARKKDIINVLKILNNHFPISDGGPSWLDEDNYEDVANQILEFEKYDS
jgi:hypothetical protein